MVGGGGALTGVLALFFLEKDTPRDPDAPRPALDIGGAVLFALALAAMLAAWRRGPEEGWVSKPVIALGAFAIVALGAFVRNEALHASPLLPAALLKTPAFALGLVGAGLLYVVTFMLAYLLSFHLQRACALTPAQAGLLMTAQPAMMAIVAPMSGWIADRFGARLPSTTGMVAIAAGMALAGTWANGCGTPGVQVAVALAIVGVGAGLFVAPNNASIMSAAPKDRQSTAAAMAATARNVGMTGGIAIAASLEHALGFRRSLYVAAGLAIAGVLLGLVRPIARS